MLAVDCVMNGVDKQLVHGNNNPALDGIGNTIPISRAFVLGRPPGHHAGPSGCVPSEFYWKRPDMTSSGFCLLNTVAVAAGYARYKYGHSLTNNTDTSLRIAIIDFDVHHGNGTEEIVRNLM